MVNVCDRCGTNLVEAEDYCPGCGHRHRYQPRPMRERVWWRVLIIGLILYEITSNLLASTGNPNLVPTVILLGAFLVPVAYVVYLYESGALYDVPVPTVALTFFWGGVLGVIAATLLEERLVQNMGFLSLLAVGFSEELAKPLGVVWLIRRHEFADELHGLVLGGAAGMGFAALETMGYGFTYLVLSHGNLDVLGSVLLTRGLLSPLAHGTWTAIVVGTIWRERTRGRFWLNRRTLGGFLIAVVLHTLWDFTASAIPIDVVLPGLFIHLRFIDLFVPTVGIPVPGLIIGLIGLWILHRMFRESEQAAVATA